MFSSLVTQRLVLRRLEPSDAERVFAYRTDPEVSRFQSWEPASPQEVRAFIERLHTMTPLSPGEWFQLGITLREGGELVGDCGLHARADDRRQVEIGITVAPGFQRQGLALEAVKSLLTFLFTRTETHRVFCSVDPRNHPSIRLLGRVGMRQEAHLKESLWIKGAWMDDLIFAVLRSEWKPEGSQPVDARIL
jgi:RimJ/RimL family protein N-acetyltransferase